MGARRKKAKKDPVKAAKRDARWKRTGKYRSGMAGNHLVPPCIGSTVSPWENSVIPGTESSIYNQSALAQQAANSYLVNSLMNRGNLGGMSNGVGHGTDASLLRQYELMRGLDNRNISNHVSSSTNSSLLGPAPIPSQGNIGGISNGVGHGTDVSLLRQYELMRGLENRNISNHVSSSTNSSLLGPAPIPSLFDLPQSNVRGIDLQRVGTAWAQSQISEYYKNLYMGGTSISYRPENRNFKKDINSKKGKVDSETKNKPEKKSPSNSDSSKASKEETCSDKDVKKEDKEKKEENKDSFLVEALQCHICELYSFQSVKSYNNHLKGAAHARIAEIFHAKNSALKELLRLSSKLYELRKKDKISRETGQNAGDTRIESTEQKLYERACKIKSCCNERFKNRHGLDEHKLTVDHLKNIYSKAQDRPEETSRSKAEVERVEEELRRLLKSDEDEDNEDEDLKRSADKESPSDAVVHDLMLLRKGRLKARDDTIPFYDPSEMRGLNFLTEKLSFYCNVCEKPVSTLHHCKSFSHYENMTSRLNKLEEEKRKQKLMEEKIVEGTKSLSIQPPKEKGETDAENVSGKTQEGKFVFMEGVINKDKGVTSTECSSHSSADARTTNQVEDSVQNVQSNSLKEIPKCESEGEMNHYRGEEDDNDDDDEYEDDLSEDEIFSDGDYL